MPELIVVYPDGRRASRKEVRVEASSGAEVKGETDYDGRFFFEWDDYWIKVIKVAGQSVKRDVSLSSLDDEVRVELPPDDLRKGSLETQASGIERRLTLKYPDGRAVERKEVVLYNGRGSDLVLRTDYHGRVSFRWPDDWIARVEVEQMPVKTNWNIGGLLTSQRELELVVPRPTDLSERDRHNLHSAGSGLGDHGVRGQLFYHDGTAVRTSFEVQVDVGGRVYSSRGDRAYCQDDGQFFIPTEPLHRGQGVRALWIDHTAVSSSRWVRTNEGFYVVLIPQGALRGGGDRGGVIAGRIVTAGGSPVAGARLQADVVSRGALGLVAPTAEARADQEGRFIMTFTGGAALSNLLVDGDTPAEVRLGEGEQAQQLSPRQLRAGLFGLTIVRR